MRVRVCVRVRVRVWAGYEAGARSPRNGIRWEARPASLGFVFAVSSLRALRTSDCVCWRLWSVVIVLMLVLISLPDILVTRHLYRQQNFGLGVNVNVRVWRCYFCWPVGLPARLYSLWCYDILIICTSFSANFQPFWTHFCLAFLSHNNHGRVTRNQSFIVSHVHGKRWRLLNCICDLVATCRVIIIFFKPSVDMFPREFKN